MWESEKLKEKRRDTSSIPKRRARRKFGVAIVTLCIKDLFAVGKGKKMGKLARVISTREKPFLKPSPCIYSDCAVSRQIVDILINNYYSDKDNLRSRTEDHVDAKCALSILFYGRRRSTRPSSTLSVSPSFFFLHRMRRTTNEGIGGRSKMLKWMKEEYGRIKRGE